MFKKFSGTPRSVMTGLAKTLAGDYREWYQTYGENLSPDKKKLSSRHITALLSGCFWELRNGELVPVSVRLTKPQHAVDQLDGRLFVTPRFDENGKPQPEHFLITLREGGSCRMFLTDRENMHLVKDSLKPSRWDRFCDGVRKLFGSRDKVCKLWDERYSKMGDIPLEEAFRTHEIVPQQPKQPAQQPSSALAALAIEADLPITEQSTSEAEFLKQDRHARSELVNGSEQLSPQQDFREKMFMAILSENVTVPGAPANGHIFDKTFMRDTLQLLSLPADNNLRRHAAAIPMSGIKLFKPYSDNKLGISDTRLCLESAQNELLSQTDLLSPDTRMMFDIYDAAELMHREKRGPSGTGNVFKDSVGAVAKLPREEKHAFYSLCRCYRELNKASRIKDDLLQGKITEAELPLAAIALQKGKQAQALLETLDGTSFRNMSPEQLTRLQAYTAASDQLDQNPQVLTAAMACVKPGDYLRSLQAVSALVERNGLARVLNEAASKSQKKAAAPENAPRQAAARQNAPQPDAPQPQKQAPRKAGPTL